MSVTVRPYRRGGWEVDIRLVLPGTHGAKRVRGCQPPSVANAAARCASPVRLRIDRNHRCLNRSRPQRARIWTAD